MYSKTAHNRILSHIIVIMTLASLGFYQSAYKIRLVSDVRFVGHADEAAYAEMGRSLIKGRGFMIRHVSTFFIPYNRDIERKEDHWPPFMGMAIAPSFHYFGTDSPQAKIPAIIFGSVGLPIAAALLGIVFSGKPIVGLICGLLMMANLHMFSESLKTLCDIAIAMLLAYFLAALIAARKYPWLHTAAGICAALAYYSKGSFILGIARYYGVTHYLYDMRRPGMDKYVDSDEPHSAFRRIDAAPGKLFRIEWEELLPGEDYVLH